MVTAALGSAVPGDPSTAEIVLIRSYAPAGTEDAVAALFALDATLGRIVRQAREPMIGQMRLTWWDKALRKLDAGERFAEPVLDGLAAHVLPRGLAGADLARMIDGWEPLLDADADATALVAAIGAARGGVLFDALATVLVARDADAAAAGAGWALADVARHVSDARLSRTLAQAAQTRIGAAFDRRWSREGRMLGALALAARYDLRGITPGSPARVARLGWHRLTGR